MDLSRYGTTFREYGRQFVLVYRNECSQAQRNQYYGLIDFVDQFLKKKEMADITATELQKITNKLNVYSNSYIGKYMTTMRGIFRTAAADGVIIRNPMDKVKRPKGKACEGHRALEDWERQLIIDTYEQHDFGLAAMTMLFTVIRKGEMLYMDIDRDIDFQNKTVAVRGTVTFSEGNQGKTSKGKTQAAQRVIPLVKPLEDALKGKHGLICPKKDGKQMSQIGIERKYESYITFLETKVNGCHKRWYGLTKEHKMKLDMGEELPPWKDITIRCHDFRVDFCTRCYEAGIPLKTLQSWMGHADTTMEVLLSRINYNLDRCGIFSFAYGAFWACYLPLFCTLVGDKTKARCGLVN